MASLWLARLLFAVVAVTSAGYVRCNKHHLSSLVSHARRRREALGTKGVLELPACLQRNRRRRRIFDEERIDGLRGGGREAAASCACTLVLHVLVVDDCRVCLVFI